MRPGRSNACCGRPNSPGPPSAPTTGDDLGRAFPAPVTRPRPSVKDACPAISSSGGSDGARQATGSLQLDRVQVSGFDLIDDQQAHWLGADVGSKVPSVEHLDQEVAGGIVEGAS